MQIDTLIKKFDYVPLDYYRMDIQHILDHFGAGKHQQTLRKYCIKLEDVYIPILVVATSKGTYVVIDIPATQANASEIFDKIDTKLKLKNKVFQEVGNLHIPYVHSKDHYFSLRKN